MVRDEFECAMEDLAETYGDLKYPEIRRAAIWEVVSEIEASDFQRIVKRAIANEKQAPMLDYFEAALKIEFDQIKNNKAATKEKTYSECSACGNRGIVFKKQKHKTNGFTYEYSYRCDCKKGTELYPKLDLLK